MSAKFYMLVGLPGSGKSAIAKELGVKVFSSDSLRKELFGNEECQDKNGELFSELHKRIKDCLKNGEDCVYDATNISAKRRTHFINNELNKIPCEKICIFVATDMNVCLQRNNIRERKVPYEVIKRMYLNFEIPQYREGWDEIIIKRTRDTMNDYVIQNFMDNLRKLNHDNPHHLLTVGDHICAATKYIIDNYSLKFAGDTARLCNLVDAMFHHDIGKAFTKSFINNKGEETDIAHYYKHENVSAYMYIMFCNENEIKDVNNVLYVADLIQLHMRMHCYGGDKKKQLDKIIKLVGDYEFEDLCIIHEADVACG